MHNFKKRNVVLAGVMLMSTMLTGCLNRDTEVVDEWVVAEDKHENMSNKKPSSSQESDFKENIEGIKKEDSLDSNKSELSNNSGDKRLDSKEEVDDKETNDNVENEELNKPVFKKSDIPESVKNRMSGKSMPNNASISYDELSYLTISHIDFNGNTREGEMVVNKRLADEVLEIFKEIYDAKFPIEQIRLVDDYDASDYNSMVNNNSSAFCYRTIAGTSKISNHGKGMAIDINPFENPHVLKSKGEVNPPEAYRYSDRSLNEKGMIKKDDVVYKAFTKRGWKWGGHWNNPDYQHFEKVVY